MDNKCHNVMLVIKDYANNYDSYVNDISFYLTSIAAGPISAELGIVL
jgi:hypothetical protein